MSSLQNNRYLTLDGMRGVAALVVAAFHFDTSLAPNGYLAVDFFFALSGFVIAANYAEKLKKGGSIIGFFQARFVRLFPLFFAGIGLGALHRLQQIMRGAGDESGIMTLLQQVSLGLLMIPNPFGGVLYPLNEVFWSVLCELAINVAFAVVLIRIPKTALVCVTVLSEVLLYLISHRISSLNGGSSWDKIDVGFMRTVFSFSIGMIIAGFRSDRKRVKSFSSVIATAALLPLMIICISNKYQLTYDLIIVFIVIPIVILAGSKVEPPEWICLPFSFLGKISYALYASHWPISIIGISLVTRLKISSFVALPIFISIAIAIATALTYFWDQPVRRYIEQRIFIRPLLPVNSQTA